MFNSSLWFKVSALKGGLSKEAADPKEVRKWKKG